MSLPPLITLLNKFKCEFGDNPLHICIRKRWDTWFDAFKSEKWFDDWMKSENECGNLPLHLAITHSLNPISLYLIERDEGGTTFFYPNIIFNSPMFLAISHKNSIVVKFMVNRMKNGVVFSGNHKELVKILDAFEKNINIFEEEYKYFCELKL